MSIDLRYGHDGEVRKRMAALFASGHKTADSRRQEANLPICNCDMDVAHGRNSPLPHCQNR